MLASCERQARSGTAGEDRPMKTARVILGLVIAFGTSPGSLRAVRPWSGRPRRRRPGDESQPVVPVPSGAR